MFTAKDILVKPIDSKSANVLCKRFHYSGKVVPNSQIHFGVFLNGRCEGVMQFGPCMAKKKMIGLVDGTGWNDFLELNRMAFSDVLPRFSESRALGIAHRILKKKYKNLKWIISFSDATQCGDGVIYRASGYKLTQIKKNTGMYKLPSGEVICSLSFTHKATKIKHGLKMGESTSQFFRRVGAVKLEGYQLRYILLLDNKLKTNYNIIPFDQIPNDVKMYKGIKRG